MTYNVFGGTLSLTQSINHTPDVGYIVVVVITIIIISSTGHGLYSKHPCHTYVDGFLFAVVSFRPPDDNRKVLWFYSSHMGYRVVLKSVTLKC